MGTRPSSLDGREPDLEGSGWAQPQTVLQTLHSLRYLPALLGRFFTGSFGGAFGRPCLGALGSFGVRLGFRSSNLSSRITSMGIFPTTPRMGPFAVETTFRPPHNNCPRTWQSPPFLSCSLHDAVSG